VTEPLLTQKEPQIPDVLTTDEVARLFRVSRRTVERLQIRSTKVGRLRRYLREDVLDYLRAKAS
jgi:excisionase family DNA binding protein